MSFVSVVIPTYNRAALVARAIQSVLDQTYPHLELIVVDDASTDNTEQALQRFSDPRIRYVRLSTNLGGSAARNTGIEGARGDFVAFLDSDDEWRPERLARQVPQLISAPSTVGVFYCARHVVEGSAIVSERWVTYEGRVRDRLLSGWCPTFMSAAIVRRSLLSRYRFDATLAGFQDYDLWLALSDVTEFRHLPEALVLAHRHEGERLTTDVGPRQRALRTLENKWRARLSEEELLLFQSFLNKHRRDLEFQELVQTVRGKDLLAMSQILARGHGAGFTWRMLLGVGLRAHLGQSISQRLRIWNHKRFGRFVGSYPENRL